VILDAALQVFGQYRYRRIAMDDIARQAQIGKGTIYLSFASKDEVFQALARRLAQQMLAGAEAASRRPATTADVPRSPTSLVWWPQYRTATGKDG
jgi:AcrR family transcriptional regulator